MVVAVLVALLAHPLMRWRVRTIRDASGTSKEDRVESVHRLRVSLLVTFGALFVLMTLAFVEWGFERRALGVPHVVGTLVIVALVVTGLVLAQRAIRPAYQDLRGIDPEDAKRARSPKRQARALVLLLPQLVWLGAIVVINRLDLNPLWTVGALVVFLLGLAVTTPALMRAARPGADADEHVRRLVEGLCERAGMNRLGGIRILDTRGNPMANAAFAGFGPGPKYLFLTDTLVEELSDDELEAVVAHELGHRKRHHIALKLATRLGALVVAALLFAAGAVVTHDVSRPVGVLLFVVALLVLVASPFLVNGAVGIALEKQADGYAAELVGPEPLRGALEKLAEVNMMKRRTGRLFNVITQHPGTEQRIERLGGHRGDQMSGRDRPGRTTAA